MNLEDRLRSMLGRRAERVQVSDNAWSAIAARTHDPQPAKPRLLLALGAFTGVLALAVASVLLLGRGPETTVLTTDPTTTTTLTTTAPATSTTTNPATTSTPIDPDPTTTNAPTTTSVPVARCSASDLSPQVGDQPDLPTLVAEMRREIVTAAVACDYDTLADLATTGASSFTFSYGAGDDPAGHWREAEARGDRPLWYLAQLLALPYGFQTGPSFADSQDIYLWPAAASGTEDDWSAISDAGLYTEEELELMRSRGSGYLGYRAGITAGGDWIFFVAGD